MPTRDPHLRLDRDTVRAEVAAALTGAAGGRGVGIEVELLPLTGTPTSLMRPPLAGEDGIIARLADAPARALLGVTATEHLDEQGWWCHDGGARISFEPGGQLEISSAYRDTPAAALSATERTTTALTAALHAAGVTLAGVGVDPWRPGTVAQQLHRPRYPAMDAYFTARGPAGRRMMRDTCALQLNLDLDAGSVAAERWEVANLLAPVTTATFANSPSRESRVRSQRSRIWQSTDPTRTGLPAGLVAGWPDPTDQLEQAVLDADVLLVDDGTMTPGRAGFSFRRWLNEGDRVHGHPTVADLRGHLTTLFHEVRPRGYLELRSVDALPARWRPAATALLAGALYDDTARGRIREVLEPQRARLPRLLRAAAIDGVNDPALCALAVEVWSFALAGAGRLGDEQLPPRARRDAEAFLDHYTLRGRCPADELARRLRADPAHALRWAAEPVPTLEVTS